MKTKTVILFLIIGLFSIAKTVDMGSSIINNIEDISLIFVICILSIIKNIFNINEKIIFLSESAILLIALYLNKVSFGLFIPLIIFDMLNEKVNLYFSIAISLIIYRVFSNYEYLNYSCVVVISNMYLYMVKDSHYDKKKLKEDNRGQRNNSFLMEQKLYNMEKYIEQSNIVTSLKERNFIAQKLHDHLGHRITSSIMQLEVTKETLGKDNELSMKYLNSSMENLREGMEEIRKVLKNMKPLDKVVGIEDIREQLLKFKYSTGIKTRLITSGNIENIKLKVWIVLEDNIRELLTNAAKYSSASNVVVSIFVYNKFARIEFKDDGEGCTHIVKSLGLNGIEERMETINGRVTYDGSNGFVTNMIVNLEDH